MALGVAKYFLYFRLRNIPTNPFVFHILDLLLYNFVETEIRVGQAHLVVPFIELGDSLLSPEPFSRVLSCVFGEDCGIPNALLESIVLCSGFEQGANSGLKTLEPAALSPSDLLLWADSQLHQKCRVSRRFKPAINLNLCKSKFYVLQFNEIIQVNSQYNAV